MVADIQTPYSTFKLDAESLAVFLDHMTVMLQEVAMQPPVKHRDLWYEVMPCVSIRNNKSHGFFATEKATEQC